MQCQIEDLRRRVDQGSQQLQGEVQELEVEAVLRAEFPTDQVVPVEKGRAGSDVIQKVVGPRGVECGAILWESKRTRNWSKEWLEKNRKDQRTSGSQIGVIVTRAMPTGLDTFDRLDGVWITSLRCMLPLAKALRLALIEAALMKSVGHGRNGKMQHLYGYVTGPQYKARVASVVEACIGMQQDDEAEKRILNKYWAKRQRRIELQSVGLYRCAPFSLPQFADNGGLHSLVHTPVSAAPLPHSHREAAQHRLSPRQHIRSERVDDDESLFARSPHR
jgi:hypothetical protein